jgi:uncharacterized protein (TIGR03084 family)
VTDEVIDDLASEYARIDGILAGLSDEQWAQPSLAVGWSVSDVVLHLTQSEEFVLLAAASARTAVDTSAPGSMDERMAALVDAERGMEPKHLLDRWRTATADAVRALRAAPADARLPWAAAPLSPRTLATTRLAEHWAHLLDITGALDIDYPDTARLRHVAWLAHRTIPYAFALAGEPPPKVRCELAGPDDDIWRYGEPDAPNVVTGPAGDFCRVAAQRLAPADSQLKAGGPDAARALELVRTYAA